MGRGNDFVWVWGRGLYSDVIVGGAWGRSHGLVWLGGVAKGQNGGARGLGAWPAPFIDVGGVVLGIYVIRGVANEDYYFGGVVRALYRLCGRGYLC